MALALRWRSIFALARRLCWDDVLPLDDFVSIFVVRAAGARQRLDAGQTRPRGPDGAPALYRLALELCGYLAALFRIPCLRPFFPKSLDPKSLMTRGEGDVGPMFGAVAQTLLHAEGHARLGGLCCPRAGMLRDRSSPSSALVSHGQLFSPALRMQLPGLLYFVVEVFFCGGTFLFHNMNQYDPEHEKAGQPAAFAMF